MLKLIKNELVKEYTFKNIIITLILFIGIAICTFIVNIYIPKLNNDYYEIKKNTYINTKRIYDEALKRYSKDKSAKNLLTLKWFSKMLENTKLFYELSDGNADDWRYDALMVDNDYNMQISILEMLSEGYNISDFYSAESKYSLLSRDEQMALYESLKAEYNKMIDIVKHGTYPQYASFILPKLKRQLEELGENAQNIDDFEINETKDKIRLYTFIADNNIQSKNDFRLKEFSSLEEVEALNNYKIVSEDNYYSNSSLVRSYYNYSDYKEALTNKRTYLNNEIIKANYALNHELKYYSNDYKNVLNNILTFFFIIGIFTVIKSGNIISSEHNNGSIRLLLTQGVSRSKIFASKVLTAILDIYIHYFTFIIIFILVGLFIYNFSDLLIPNLNVINNKIVLSNYFIDFIRDVFIVSLPIVLLAMLSILLSVITWNSVIAVGINIFLLITSSFYLWWIRLYHLGVIWQYTPIPYLSMTRFMHLYGPNQIDNYDFITSTYNLDKGIIILIIWIVNFYGISRIIFTRKDIVNE